MYELSTFFNQREIETIDFVVMEEPITKKFPPKKSNYYQYIFDQVDPQCFDICIQYFRDPNSKLTNHQYLIGLAGLCRSIITVPGIWKYYFSICEDFQILHLPEYVKKETDHNYNELRCALGSYFIETHIDIELRKISLFAFDIHRWLDFLHMIKKNCADGLFHHFTFEESVFFLYYFPLNPIFIFSRKKYHKNINLYIECLAAAVKAFMEKFDFKNNLISNSNNISSLSEKIFLDFLDFYETKLKTNEKTCKYFQ